METLLTSNAGGQTWAALRGLWRRHPYTIAAILMSLVMAWPFLVVDRDWEICLLLAAKNLGVGDTVYGHKDLYPYAPFPALVALPFTLLPRFAGALLFYGLNLAALFLMIRWAWQLAGGGPLEGDRPTERSEHRAMLLGLLASLTFTWNCLAHHQTDLFIGAAALGGCLALSRSRGYLAATCFGLAAALKGPDLLWAPYLALRGRWKEAMWVGVVFVGLNVLPTVLVPAQHGRFLFAEWLERYVQPMGERPDYPYFWTTESNQSLIGCAYRWLTTTWAWHGAFEQKLPIAHPASPAMVRAAVLIAAAVLFLFTLFCLGRRAWPGRDDEAGQARLGLECSMIFLLMLLLSPMSGKAHFGTLMLPGFCLARAMFRSRDLLLPGMFVCVLVGLILSQNFMGKYIAGVSLWYGCVTWATLLLLLGCGYALRRGTVSLSAVPPRSHAPPGNASLDAPRREPD